MAGPAAALASTPWNPSLLRTHRGEAQSYSSRDTCAPPARTYRYGAAFLHSAVLTGLAPGKPHFYQVCGWRAVGCAAPRWSGVEGSWTGRRRGGQWLVRDFLPSPLTPRARLPPPSCLQIDGGEVVEFTAGVGAGPRHSFTFLVFGDLGESVHRAAKSPG